MTSPDRAAALAALATGAPAPAPSATPAPSPADVVEVAGGTREGGATPAGGDTVVVMTRDEVPLVYGADSPAGLRYVYPAKGEAVAVTDRQAKRLLGLGWAVAPGTAVVEVAEPVQGGTVTDAELEAMTAPELTAYVAQHPDERERVHDLELRRKTPRKTVLAAVAPTPEEDLAAAEAALDAAGDDDEDEPADL